MSVCTCTLRMSACIFLWHTLGIQCDTPDIHENMKKCKICAREHSSDSWKASTNALVPSYSLAHPLTPHFTQLKNEEGGMELIAYAPRLKHNIWRQDHPEVNPISLFVVLHFLRCVAFLFFRCE